MTTAAPVRPATLSRNEAARYVGVQPSTLARWATEDRGPPFLKLSPARSGRIRYSVQDLDRWLAEGAPTNRRGARPTTFPRDGFSRPDADVRRDPRGRFSRHPGQ